MIELPAGMIWIVYYQIVVALFTFLKHHIPIRKKYPGLMPNEVADLVFNELKKDDTTIILGLSTVVLVLTYISYHIFL